jgi:hypothetical protein
MLSCALFVCESGRTFAFFDSVSRSLVLFENDKIVAYDVPVFTDLGNGRIEQVDSFVASGSEVNPNYNQNENPLPHVAKEENVVHVPFKPAIEGENPELMTMTTFNLPPNAEGVVAVVDSNASAKIIGSSYENVMHSDGTRPNFISMNEKSTTPPMLISGINGDTIKSSYDPISKDNNQSTSGKNKDNSSSGSKNGLDGKDRGKDSSNEEKNVMDKTNSMKKNDKSSKSYPRNNEEDENFAASSLVWMAVVFVLPCLLV